MASLAFGSVSTATSGLFGLAGLPWLVGGRFIQGLGGGGMVPLSLALAADLYRNRSRAVALGSVAGLQEAGSVVGPIYGATLAAAAASAGGWRFVFWINLPLAGLCAAGLFAARRADSTAPSGKNKIDWIIALVLGAGLGALVVGLAPEHPGHCADNA